MRTPVSPAQGAVSCPRRQSYLRNPGGTVRSKIAVPLTPVKTGISRSLADSQLRSSGHVKALEGPDSQADSRRWQFTIMRRSPGKTDQRRWSSLNDGRRHRGQGISNPPARLARAAGPLQVGEPAGQLVPGDCLLYPNQRLRKARVILGAVMRGRQRRPQDADATAAQQVGHLRSDVPSVIKSRHPSPATRLASH